MGATCDTIERYEMGSLFKSKDAYFFPAGGCAGPLPAHLKRLLLAVPKLPTESLDQRLQSLDAEAYYLAAPGMGRRPDFLASIGPWVIRTFEGPDPTVTIAAVWEPGCPRTSESDCFPRFYRMTGGKVAEKAGVDVWPGRPFVSESDWAYMQAHGTSEPILRFDKLGYAPTFHWMVEYDPDNMPPPDAPLPPGWASGHLGFMVWNGNRFELRTTVSRRWWPCMPVYRDEKPCSDIHGDYPTRYVSP